MLRAIRTPLLAALVIITVLSACKKKDNPDTPDPDRTLAEDQAKMQSFFDANRTPAESFTFSATAGTTHISTDGSVLIIPPSAFNYADGSPVTSNITAYFTEYNSPSEMLLGNRPTVTSTGQILESAGEFKLTAKAASGGEIFLRPGAAQVIIPADSVVGVNPEMQGWVGDTTIQTTMSGRDYQNAVATMTAPSYYNPGVTWNQENILSVTPSGYEVIIDSLGEWYNADVIKVLPGVKTTFFGYMNEYNDSTVASYQGIEPSMLFFKPDGTNSLVKMYNPIFNPPSGYAGFHSYQNSVPIGLTGKFLAITTKDNKFYAELKTNTAVPTVVSGADYCFLNFSMVEVTEAQLLALILSLN